MTNFETLHNWNYFFSSDFGWMTLAVDMPEEHSNGNRWPVVR
jgi:hypothetical protein